MFYFYYLFIFFLQVYDTMIVQLLKISRVPSLIKVDDDWLLANTLSLEVARVEGGVFEAVFRLQSAETVNER